MPLYVKIRYKKQGVSIHCPCCYNVCLVKADLCRFGGELTQLELEEIFSTGRRRGDSNQMILYAYHHHTTITYTIDSIATLYSCCSSGSSSPPGVSHSGSDSCM